MEYLVLIQAAADEDRSIRGSWGMRRSLGGGGRRPSRSTLGISTRRERTTAPRWWTCS